MDRLEDVIDLAYDLVQIGSGSARTNLEEGMLIQKAVSLAIFSEQLGVQVL